MSNKIYLKITYTDGTEMPWGEENEQIFSRESEIQSILEQNNITIDDLPYSSEYGYKIELD